MAKFTIEIDTDDTHSVYDAYHMLGKLIAMWKMTLNNDPEKIPDTTQKNKPETEG